MVPTKSQVEFYVDLFELMLRCNPCLTASESSVKRDILTIRQRSLHEGLSFLTKTLPLLGKALDRGLIESCFKLPSEFSHSHGNTNIPAFMQAYFKHVFDDDGNLLDNASPAVIKHLRQVCFFAYKLEVPYSPSTESRILDTFEEVDNELHLDLDEDHSKILDVASFITEDIFKDFDPLDIIPRHGPGAVATGERLEDKWQFSRLYDSIHQVYPYYDFFMVGRGRELIDRLGWYKNLTRLDQGQAKVLLVPKDSRGPRLISCEPLEYQWIQQGLGRKIVSHLESNWMTSGQINFTLQSINAALALSSSLDQYWGTLDLQEASDRVSVELVKGVFKRCPRLLRALLGTRTSATKLPNGRVISLRKFAPMGSALCFPVESFIFWVLIVAAISRINKERQALVGKRVFVYGDDIIIKAREGAFCIDVLESFGLKVNAHKSCIQGFFRESCGTDAFKGINVTPIRLRTLWSGRKTDGSAYVSYIETMNTLSSSGYVLCSEYLRRELEGTYGKLPYGTSRASYPCILVSDPDEAERKNLQFFRSRSSRRYQRVEFYIPKIQSKRRRSKLDGWLRMLRNFTLPPYGDPSSIVIPRSMVINRGWTAVF